MSRSQPGSLSLFLSGLALLVTTSALAQTPVYYSVGTSAADLKSSASLTVTFAAGTATFSESQADNIGVGDEITYNTSNKAYISSRTSATVYSVRTAIGGVPVNVTNATVNSIRRAFNSLTAAESGSADAAHLNATDLPLAGFQLHLACYADGPMDDGEIVIDGWTTGPSHYIRVFAPSTPSEVGRSQRHTGKAGTGFRLLRTADLTGVPAFRYFFIYEEYVRIEGIELDGSNLTNGSILNPVRVENSVSPTSDLRFDKMILHDFVNSNVAPATDSDVLGFLLRQGSVKISNTIIYNLDQRNTNATSTPFAIEVASTNTGTSYLHNNTVYNVKISSGNTGTARGIVRNGGTVTARNNVVLDVDSPNGLEFCFVGAAMTQSNNVSSDATATGTGSQTNQTAYSTYFRNINPGSEDLHLRNDSRILWGSDGADLDADPNLPIPDDIDGQPRHATAPDIGADEPENVATYSVGISAADLKSSGALTVTLVSGTATFSEAQAANVGVGDQVIYNVGSVAYVAARTSATVYSLRTATGGIPADVAGVSVNSIRRAFNSLTAAQTGSFDASHLNTQDLPAGNFQLHWACYNDGPLNDRLDLAGWTTGARNYIRIFAPASITEVGISQRHTGVAGTGFRVAPVDATVQGYNLIVLRTTYVRIDGLELDGSGLTNATLVRGVYVVQNLSTIGDLRMDSSLIHDLHTTQGGANSDGSFGSTRSSRWRTSARRCASPTTSSTTSPRIRPTTTITSAGSTSRRERRPTSTTTPSSIFATPELRRAVRPGASRSAPGRRRREPPPSSQGTTSSATFRPTTTPSVVSKPTTAGSSTRASTSPRTPRRRASPTRWPMARTFRTSPTAPRTST